MKLIKLKLFNSILTKEHFHSFINKTISIKQLLLYNFEYLNVLQPLLTEELKLKLVNHDSFFIQYIKNPSEAVQLEAVKSKGIIIQYIQNPSKEVQIEAVKQNGFAIDYIKNPTEEVQLEAIKKNPHAINYIQYPTNKVKLLHKKLYETI